MKLIYVLILMLSLSACGGCSKPCVKKKCKDFKTQKEAQAAYDSDKNCYKNLDRDGDGKPCEDLPKE